MTAQAIEPISQTYRIVRRTFSVYTTVEEFTGTFIEVNDHCMKLERENRDGEYLYRRPGQPDWESGSSYQSGFDWL